MTVQLNHTIVPATDSRGSARFLAEVLGLGEPQTYGPFQVVELTNGVSLDYMQVERVANGEHYAFLVSEAEFDEIFGRIRARGLDYWADPMHAWPGEINHHDGGRGVYFPDPDGPNLEIITRPYGSGTDSDADAD